ncbi:hypothetical protein BDQ12DRAFT_726431 [Crucibulum laeve]|uniref:cystathionine gamma-lyase n=1 Tax=Crucibulum laeve TaxID=68775 RepID=A0A5C3LQ04_9AGAR|nr:hypothetical protein BDQ12DRAFT_726431 [Crucibulum laeve]
MPMALALAPSISALRQTRALALSSLPGRSGRHKENGVGIYKSFEYSRSGNPSRNALNNILASLESGGAHALAFAYWVRERCAWRNCPLFDKGMAKENQGLETTFLDLENAGDEEVLVAIRPNTEVFLSIFSTTKLNVDRISSLFGSNLLQILPSTSSKSLASPQSRTHSSHLIVLVDNTFLSPFYSSPLLFGDDIVLRSLARYVNGHSGVVMSALILPAHHEELT